VAPALMRGHAKQMQSVGVTGLARQDEFVERLGLTDLAAAMVSERRAENFLESGHRASYSQWRRANTIANPGGAA